MSEHNTDGATSRGLFDSRRDCWRHLTALAQTRLELVGTELEQVRALAILLV
jgi:hypothetical protein